MQEISNLIGSLSGVLSYQMTACICMYMMYTHESEVVYVHVFINNTVMIDLYRTNTASQERK